MVIVPKGKTICIGGRKFVEGDIIPPYFNIEIPEMTRDEAENKAKKESKPSVNKKRNYRSRSGGMFEA